MEKNEILAKIKEIRANLSKDAKWVDYKIAVHDLKRPYSEEEFTAIVTGGSFPLGIPGDVTKLTLVYNAYEGSLGILYGDLDPMKDEDDSYYDPEGLDPCAAGDEKAWLKAVLGFWEKIETM